MISNTSISRCLKDGFSVIERIGEDVHMLRWGKKDVVEKVSVLNEETGEHELTGETLETDWCTYESGEYRGVLSKAMLDRCFARSQRPPKMRELMEVGAYMGMTEEQMLPWMKERLLDTVARYDKSSEVEDFTVGGVHLWLNSEMRAKVRENLETAQQKGEENVTLRYNGMAFPMTVAMGWQLYYAVLDYARATWDVTEIHNAAIPSLETVDAVCEYEEYFPTAYPEKLAF